MIETLGTTLPAADGFRLSGTVLADDVTATLSEYRSGADGLLLVIDKFDGYWAEVMRAVAAWQKGEDGAPYKRIAIIANPGLGFLAETDLKEWVDTPSRVFAPGSEAVAEQWLDA